jgi:hypothetical protein
MKDPRTEKIVNELKETVAKLNRIDALLQKMDVTYNLGRTRRDLPWALDDIVQKVEY